MPKLTPARRRALATMRADRDTVTTAAAKVLGIYKEVVG